MANPEVNLFKKRQNAIRKEKSYYNKFIFNGHFSVFLLILLGAFIMGYGQWLQHIPKHIDYALVISIVFAITSIFPLRTLLKEADQLFLLPFEKNMSHYMKLSINYSFFNRIPIQIILLIIITPLILKLDANNLLYLILFGVLTLVHPYIALNLRWKWYKARFSTWSINLIIFLINVFTFYLILGLHQWWGVIFTFIFLGIMMVPKINSKNLYPWEKLIRVEQRHHTNYYKFVNMFTDVKQLKERAVRRRYLDPLLLTPNNKRFNENHMYLFLFTRSFARGKDAFNIILRLLIIALVLMIWLSHPIVTIIIGCLFMYITLLQMSQFYTQQAYGLWPQVWPVSDKKVIKGYEQFLYRLMFIIGIIFSINFIILYPTLFIFGFVFFIVGWLTIRSIIKKLKYQEELLRD